MNSIDKIKKITVPICNICNKPHFGRSKVEDRCVCDCSGNFHLAEIIGEPKTDEVFNILKK